MADPFSPTQVAEGLAEIRELRGEPVTYARAGSFSLVGLQAVSAPYRDERDSVDGEVDLSARYRDFLIATDALVFGTAVTPLVGDTVTTASGSVFQVVEVAGGNAWRWSDSGRAQRRIHTVEVTP